MLPIPVPIIGSNKRLFIPLIYLAVTASICYLFLLALVRVNPDHYHKRNLSELNFKNKLTTENPSGEREKERKSQRTRTFEKYKREVDTDLFYDPYSDKRNLSTFASWKSKKKKFEEDTGTIRSTGDNGTWRSDSTEIRSGYQDRLWIVDSLAPSVQPWANDEECRHYRINFAKKHTFEPRALVSFPGSGNSWLRYLIECSTGFFTGSIFHDTAIFSSGRLGELRDPTDGSTIVQKSHHDAIRYSNSKTKKAYVKLSELIFKYRGILLVRNPYDALVSYWNFIQTRDHQGYADPLKLSRSKWQTFVTNIIPKWSSLITSFVENSQSLLIVQYEKLKENPRQELIRILEYLNQPLDISRLNCLLKEGHIEGPFHRRHKDQENHSFSNFSNNSASTMTGESETREKNFLDFAQVPEWNSKSWRYDEEQSSLDRNISPNDHYHHLPSLDLIVQDNINKINHFFSEKNIPIFLNYNGPSPSHCCTH